MANRRFFTEEEIAILKSNPYTGKVSGNSISFTVEFKQMVLNEIEKPGMTMPKIFRKAGYDPDMIGRSRIDSTLRYIRIEAASPKGLHTTYKTIERVSQEDFSRRQTKTAIRELQNHVAYLEEQIDFLKKISQLPPK